MTKFLGAWATRIPGRALPFLLILLILLISGCGDGGSSPPAALPDRPRISAEEAMRMPFPRSPNDPGTVDFETIGFHEGASDARITVVEFSDFGCPYCAQFSLETYPELKRDFIEPGLIRWIYVPFVMGNFPNGDLAARAGECARELGHFPAMKEQIYRAQRQWRSGSDPADLFAALAEEVGADGTAFRGCYEEGGGSHRTRANNRAAADLGVRATPTFLIEGRRVEGALPAEQFREVLRMLTGNAGD